MIYYIHHIVFGKKKRKRRKKLNGVARCCVRTANIERAVVLKISEFELNKIIFTINKVKFISFVLFSISTPSDSDFGKNIDLKKKPYRYTIAYQKRNAL